MDGRRRRNEKLRSARVRRGWTQEQAADRAHRLAAQLPGQPDLGINYRYFSRWENGAVPEPTYIALLCLLYETPSPADLGLPTQHVRAPVTHHPLGSPISLTTPAAASTLDHQAPTIPTPSLAIIGPNEPLPYRLNEDTYQMMRRQFLQHLLAVAGGVVVAPAYLRSPLSAAPTDVGLFVQECESNMRACWRLMQGRDMVVVPSVLTSWLPLLDSMLRDSPPYRRELAALAAEGYMLAGLVTVLQGHVDRSEWFCQQAVDYAAVAGHPDLTVAALKHLATKYLDAQYPVLTLRTYERAAEHLTSVSPLLRGRTHLGLALAHAQVGNNTDAERHLALAHDTFPDRPEDDPAFQYTDARRASLNHYGGLIHLISGRPAEAWQTFGAALRDPAAGDVPERTVIEIVNCQAEAAIALGDVELASSHLETAIQGARNLRSPKRYRDSLALYYRLRARWPADSHVKRLQELFAPDSVVSPKQ